MSQSAANSISRCNQSYPVICYFHRCWLVPVCYEMMSLLCTLSGYYETGSPLTLLILISLHCTLAILRSIFLFCNRQSTVRLVLGNHLSVSRHVVDQNRWSFNRWLLIWLVNQSITDLRRFKYVHCTTPAVTLLLLLLLWETCSDCRDREVSKLSGWSLMTRHITLQVNVNRRSISVGGRDVLTTW